MMIRGVRAPAHYGVLVVAVVFASTALSVGSAQYGFSTFITPLESSFGWSRTEISAALSFAAVSGLTAPFIGRAMDRYGTRPILVFSLLVTGISFGLRPAMTELWQWYALSLLQYTAFSGATMLPMGKLVATWFARTRGRAMGIAAMGNNVGGLVVPPAIVAVLAAASWREAYIMLSLAAFGLALLALLVVVESPATRRSQRPQSLQSLQSLRSPPRARTGTPPPPPAAEAGLNVREALRTPRFYAILTAVTLGTFTYSTFLPHVYAHLVTSGLDAETATFTLSALAVGGIAGKLVFGLSAERFDPRRAMILNLSTQALFGLALALATTRPMLIVVTPLFGLCMGGFGVLMALVVQHSFGLRHFGSLMGLVNTSSVVSFGLGPVIAGVSFDTTGAYSTGFVVTAGLFAIGALVLAIFGGPGRARSIATARAPSTSAGSPTGG